MPAGTAGRDDDQLSETMSDDERASGGQESDYGSDYEMEDDSDSGGEVVDSTMGKVSLRRFRLQRLCVRAT